MSQPTPYTQATDFSQDEANNVSGRSTVDTAALDAEFSAISTTLGQTLANLALIQRDDGNLRDASVTVPALSRSVINLIGGFTVRGAWTTATDYAVNDIVSDNGILYLCEVAHTSPGAFVESPNWSNFGFAGAEDAAIAAAQAAASATDAAASATAAGASETAAGASQTAAAASASAAASSASSANASAGNASASASSASNSAVAAAASAAAITLPVPVASGGTGATNASAALTALGGASLSALAASSGSNLVGFLQSGTGATARTAQAKLRDVVSVKDFGAVGDGTTNDTTAIQNAINAAAGGAVNFPAGTYKITGTLAMTVAGGHAGTMLVGSGIEATILYFDNGTGDCITVTGTDTGAGQFNGFTMRDMTISHGTKTGGRTVVVSFAYKVRLECLLINNCWTGIEGYVTNNFNLYDINIQGVVGGGNAPTYLGPVSQAPDNCYGVFWHAPHDGSYRSDALRLMNVTVQASFSGADGFLWDGGATTVDANQFTLLSCNYGIRIRNTGVSNANYPQFGEFVNTNTDGAMTTGLRIEGGAGMHFTGCNLMNTSGISGQGNADTNAVTIIPDESGSFTRAITFTGCNFNNCREDVVSASARDMKFVGCDFHDGGKAASNTYSGLVIGADAEDVIVSACSFSRYGSNNNFKYGITVTAGSVRVIVDGNYIYNAQTMPINWLTTDSNSRCYNNVSESTLHQDIGQFCNVKSANLSAGNVTLTGDETLYGIVVASGAAVARDLTLATAAQIVAELQNPMVGAMFEVNVMNTGSATVSVAGNTGLTINGNHVTSKYEIAAGATRRLLLRINVLASGSEAVAVYG